MVDFKSNNQHSTEVQTCSINLRGLTKIYINIFGPLGCFCFFFFLNTLVGQSCLMFDIIIYLFIFWIMSRSFPIFLSFQNRAGY